MVGAINFPFLEKISFIHGYEGYDYHFKVMIILFDPKLSEGKK